MSSLKMVKQEEARKGPWTEKEDAQLGFYVNLFGDRRWDFIAKVSGLKRTGKSCRLRWVNYMHPGLKRGKLTPQEERLVRQLHAKWGNSWSKIARKVPGRTDNDIKNYWRTHLRKEAQEKKKATMLPPSSSPLSGISSSSNSPAGADTTKECNFYDTGGLDMCDVTLANHNPGTEQCPKVYSIDEIWKDDVALPEEDKIINPVFDHFNDELGSTTMITSIWDDNYYSNNASLWSMDHQYFPGQSNMMTMPPSLIDAQQFDSFNICS